MSCWWRPQGIALFAPRIMHHWLLSSVWASLKTITKNKREKKLGNNIAEGMKKMNLGLGRGCTMETKSKVLPVGQLKEDSDHSDTENNEITVEENEREIFSAEEEKPTRTEEGDDGDLIPQFTLNSYLSLKTEN
ncbi:uncharacterized protein LOC111632575 isoform X1 [Centruroides sculpturatus]|uniref:uncharacterized protein LOC111632575 isoform X1 n=1 Tax=Centruroides sculpturatus TaxID=218467 RepID=UPI000C6E0A9D|nr:uncharacterized protein LOC111632575 isoform X1 [Centruroides sculpturatus]